jgi:hypothetical protein
MKLMVISVGRSLVFSGSQKKYFVLYLRWFGEGNFLVQILCH